MNRATELAHIGIAAIASAVAGLVLGLVAGFLFGSFSVTELPEIPTT